MKGFNLVTMVTNLTNKLVSEEEAKEFALKNFGELCAAIRAEHVRYILSQRREKPKQVYTGQPLTPARRIKLFGFLESRDLR
jgi:hypothetical protein